MKTKTGIFLLASLFLLSLAGCKKDELGEAQKNIKKLWKLDKYLINSVDKTSSMIITNYTESYTDNMKYDRSYDNPNGQKITQNGSYEFETSSRLKISGVGSIEFTNNGTASSSYYNILRLTDTELWYNYTNGSSVHEFRLSRKQ
jgi:hypothetical protein